MIYSISVGYIRSVLTRNKRKIHKIGIKSHIFRIFHRIPYNNLILAPKSSISKEEIKKMQKQIQKINEISSMQKFIAKRNQNVESLLKELKLETKYFAVLVNGEKADFTTELKEKDEVIILPKIAGGL